ncbi:hypothetical protein DVH24_016836 [Malus domestica]|uniref:Uncharacterized protein n=1 Tax=Malus domestica TaxID=3750 RepID=A0A498HUS3_MALDO|nr:hypothetical protein DVH24_016836 [Malus domestica]
MKVFAQNCPYVTSKVVPRGTVDDQCADHFAPGFLLGFLLCDLLCTVRLRFSPLDARVDHRCATPAPPLFFSLFPFRFHFSHASIIDGPAFASLSLAVLSSAILNSSFVSPKRRIFSPSNLPSFSQELSTTVQLDPIQFFIQKRWHFLVSLDPPPPPLPHPNQQPHLRLILTETPRIERNPSFILLHLPVFPDLANVFEVLLPQLLLYPNPFDALNGEAAALMMFYQAAYEQRVKGIDCFLVDKNRMVIKWDLDLCIKMSYNVHYRILSYLFPREHSNASLNMIMQANIVLYLTNVTKLKQQLSLDVRSSHSLKEIVKNWIDSKLSTASLPKVVQ